MAARNKSLVVRSTVMGLMLLSGAVSRLNSAVPPAAVSAFAAPAVQKISLIKPKAVSSRISSDECSTLAVNAAIAKARAEMRSLLPGTPKDLTGITTAMDSDRRLAENIKQTFGYSDLIVSEYSKRGECVVTLKLPLDRLQRLARDL